MQLTTCLWFDGQARQAAQFYTSIFPESSMGSNWVAPTETPGNEQGGESPEGSQAATQAMLKMKKLDLSELKRAYEAAAN
ncbi:MAG: hypothetical protein EBU89_01850 [Actinobacteria bacterium]|nr:hypothetical protein [Actinomycetota bacterium]NBO34669.1 hypothetical protein [Actinomycetota bacterium]